MVAAQVSEQVSTVLADLEDQLDGMTPVQQSEWLSINRRPYAPHLQPLNSADTPKLVNLGSAQTRAIARALKKSIPGIGEIRESTLPKHQLWVRVTMLGQPWWLVVPLGRFKIDPTWTLGLSATVFALVALIGSAIFAWRINRPLRELQSAATQLGRGERPKALPETGPLEVKELSASFNRMLADIDTSERERNLMLAGISHDLRTPLARLQLGVEMMQDESLRDGMAEDIDDIQRILSQFIDFIRGAGAEEASLVDPAEVARGLIARYARSGCDIALELADDLPLATLRHMAISRALSNLIDNARRYGRSPISLDVQVVDGMLQFVVSDCGDGIPDNQLSAVLEPFQRLNVARTADGGSGLGLAIVERIVRHVGGTLRLQNRAGGGLAATIRLPLHSTELADLPSLTTR